MMGELEAAIPYLTSKWKLPIMGKLLNGQRHFGELHRALDGISKKMLSKDLRDLEREGLVNKKEYYDGKIVLSEFTLTNVGLAFCSIIPVLADCGSRYTCAARKIHQHH